MKMFCDFVHFSPNYGQKGLFQKWVLVILGPNKSLLFSNNECWKKKNTESCFDVTKGSFDGAEICELVGLFILNELTKFVNKGEIGFDIEITSNLKQANFLDISFDFSTETNKPYKKP